MSENSLDFHSLTETLVNEKERLGSLNVIEIKANDMAEAHELLGKEVAIEAKESLIEQLNSYTDYEKFKTDTNAMQMVHQQIMEKISNPNIPPKIKEGLKDYLTCLKTRSQGIGTETIKHPLLERYIREHEGQEDFIYHTLLSLSSQNDNVGCQSGMVRKDEKIMLWHTEEDYEDEKEKEIDKAKLIKFNVNGNVKYSFVYPSLMPGPAFGFGNNFFYSVDFDYIKTNEKPSILANIGVWVAWRLAEEMPPEEIIKHLSPYLDGYTLNYVWRNKNKDDYQAGKIEFAHDLSVNYPLENKPLISVNKLEEFSPLKKFEEMNENEANLYNRRINRAKRSLALIDKLVEGKSGSLENLRRMTGFRSKKNYGEAGMTVDFTKAHTVAQVTNEGMLVWVSAGPTVKNEEITIFDLRNKITKQ